MDGITEFLKQRSKPALTTQDLTPMSSPIPLSRTNSPTQNSSRRCSKFTSERLFKNEEGAKCTTPRNPDVFFEEKKFHKLHELNVFLSWFENNVEKYLFDKRWNRIIPPQRILLSCGPPGMGKLSQITMRCHSRKINLLHVPLYFLEPEMWFKIFAYAVEIQPVILYVEHMDVMMSPHYTNILAEFCAAFHTHINTTQTNIWVIVTTPIDAIKPISQCRFLMDILNNNGSIIQVTSLNDEDNASRKQIIEMLFCDILRVPSFPIPSEPKESVWKETINLSALYARYCTIREIRQYIVDIYQLYYQTRPMLTSSIGLDDTFADVVPVEMFRKGFETLPCHRNNSEVKSLAYRNVITDITTAVDAWNEYTTRNKVSKILTLTPTTHVSTPPLRRSQPSDYRPALQLQRPSLMAISTPPSTPPYENPFEDRGAALPYTGNNGYTKEHEQEYPVYTSSRMVAPYSPTSPAHYDTSSTSPSRSSYEYEPEYETPYVISSPTRQHAAASYLLDQLRITPDIEKPQPLPTRKRETYHHPSRNREKVYDDSLYFPAPPKPTLNIPKNGKRVRKL